MKTAELTGVALDWAVCKAKGEYQCPVDEYTAVWMTNRRYSTDWLLGGPIIEREGVCLWSEGYDWEAKIQTGPGEWLTEWDASPLVAAMRCYVASKLGDEVEIPEGLK